MATKRKKRHINSTAAAKQRVEAAAIADQKDRARKRMDPVARTILFGDLAFLAVCMMLEQRGYMSNTLNTITTIFGAALIPVALYFQFIKKDGGGSNRLK